MAIVLLPGGWVDVRAITGHDEQTLAASGDPLMSSAVLAASLTLIDRLVIARPGALIAPGEAAALTSAARDRLLTALYRQIYGDMVHSSPRCVRCGKPFDLSFRLAELVQSLAPASVASDGIYQTVEGVNFRLPTGADELAVLGLSVNDALHTLLMRCLVDAPASVAWDEAQIGAVEAAMEAAAPLVNLDLSAECPECGAVQKIRFDIGAYLIGRLSNDSVRLTSEVHALAVTYHWGLHEILSLSRVERSRYLALIDADANRARLRASGGTRRRIG